jgi:hypothetical protein
MDVKVSAKKENDKGAKSKENEAKKTSKGT